jgi:diketogulonate reductase-like aldo/keto reductase
MVVFSVLSGCIFYSAITCVRVFSACEPLRDGMPACCRYREDLVGEGLAASTISRDKVFITTKVHPREFGSASTRRALNKTLQDLRTPYVDLVLLHYSECWGNLCADKKPEGDWKEAWRALELLVDANVVRCIGVSNFGIDDMAKLLRFARHKPCLLQRNSEPLNPDVASQAFCRHHGIQYEGYSTLGGQYNHKQSGNPILEHPVITAMASARGRTPAQLVLRWALQQNQAVIPRSSNRDHLRGNLNGVFDFDLADDELYTLASLP